MRLRFFVGAWYPTKLLRFLKNMKIDVPYEEYYSTVVCRLPRLTEADDC